MIQSPKIVLTLIQLTMLVIVGCIQPPKGEIEINSKDDNIRRVQRQNNPVPAEVGNWSGKAGQTISASTLTANYLPSTLQIAVRKWRNW